MDEFIQLLPAMLSVFGVAFLYFWAAIPAGLALGVPPVVIVMLTTSSYALGVAMVTVLGEPVRRWILKRVGDRATLPPGSALARVWERYGIAGLGLLAPMTVGSQVGAVIGMALGAPRSRLIVWMIAGALAWSVLLTVLFSLGVLGAQQLAGTTP